MAMNRTLGLGLVPVSARTTGDTLTTAANNNSAISSLPFRPSDIITPFVNGGTASDKLCVCRCNGSFFLDGWRQGDSRAEHGRSETLARFSNLAMHST
jgi:hypothetical protein